MNYDDAKRAEVVEKLARSVFDLEDGSRWSQATEGLREAYRDSIRKALSGYVILTRVDEANE